MRTILVNVDKQRQQQAIIEGLRNQMFAGVKAPMKLVLSYSNIAPQEKQFINPATAKTSLSASKASLVEVNYFKIAHRLVLSENKISLALRKSVTIAEKSRTILSESALELIVRYIIYLKNPANLILGIKNAATIARKFLSSEKQAMILAASDIHLVEHNYFSMSAIESYLSSGSSNRLQDITGEGETSEHQWEYFENDPLSELMYNTAISILLRKPVAITGSAKMTFAASAAKPVVKYIISLAANKSALMTSAVATKLIVLSRLNDVTGESESLEFQWSRFENNILREILHKTIEN
jgi:hypothetical protein